MAGIGFKHKLREAAREAKATGDTSLCCSGFIRAFLLQGGVLHHIYCRTTQVLQPQRQRTVLLIHRHHRKVCDATHVGAPFHAHVASLAPSAPERVFDDPIRSAISNNCNCRRSSCILSHDKKRHTSKDTSVIESLAHACAVVVNAC